MKLSGFGVIAACAMLLWVVGCKKESTQLPPDARKVEVVTSNGTAVTLMLGDFYAGGTNGEKVPAIATIVSVSADPRISGKTKEPSPATNSPQR